MLITTILAGALAVPNPASQPRLEAPTQCGEATSARSRFSYFVDEGADGVRFAGLDVSYSCCMCRLLDRGARGWGLCR